MFSAYVIEINDEAAGIIARDNDQSGKFFFYASSRLFYPLEGREFGSVQAAYRAVKRVFRARSLSSAI